MSGGTGSGPVLRVVNHVASELRASSKLQAEALRSTDVWSRLPSVVQRLSETANNAIAGDGGNGTG